MDDSKNIDDLGLLSTMKISSDDTGMQFSVKNVRSHIQERLVSKV